MPTLHAIIFDWGGVLMRTEDYSYREAWDQRLGKPYGYVESVVHGIPEWVDAQMGSVSVEDYWQAVRRALSLSAADLKSLRADFYRGDQLDAALVGILRDMKSNRVKTGLLSNNSNDLENSLAQMGINPLFDSVAISSRIGVMKPSPESYQIILNHLDVSPQSSLFVDDSSINIHGAQAVGLQTILFNPGLDLRSVLASKFPHLGL